MYTLIMTIMKIENHGRVVYTLTKWSQGLPRMQPCKRDMMDANSALGVLMYRV